MGSEAKRHHKGQMKDLKELEELVADTKYILGIHIMTPLNQRSKFEKLVLDKCHDCLSETQTLIKSLKKREKNEC